MAPQRCFHVWALAFLPFVLVRAAKEIPAHNNQAQHLRHLTEMALVETLAYGNPRQPQQQAQTEEMDWPLEETSTQNQTKAQNTTETTPETNTYFSLNASPKGQLVCVRPYGDVEDGDQLELAECSGVETRWRIDSNGLIHTIVNDNYCWQASNLAPPEANQFIRLFFCNSANALQQFTYDGTNIKPKANTNLCATWRGQEADTGGTVENFFKDLPGMSVLRAIPLLGGLIPQGADPILMKNCLTTTSTAWTFS